MKEDGIYSKIHLKKARIGLIKSEIVDFVFCIKKDKKTLVLKAKTQRELDYWIETIKAIENANIKECDEATVEKVRQEISGFQPSHSTKKQPTSAKKVRARSSSYSGKNNTIVSPRKDTPAPLKSKPNSTSDMKTKELNNTSESTDKLVSRQRSKSMLDSNSLNLERTPSTPAEKPKKKGFFSTLRLKSFRKKPKALDDPTSPTKTKEVEPMDDPEVGTVEPEVQIKKTKTKTPRKKKSKTEPQKEGAEIDPIVPCGTNEVENISVPITTENPTSNEIKEIEPVDKQVATEKAVYNVNSEEDMEAFVQEFTAKLGIDLNEADFQIPKTPQERQTWMRSVIQSDPRRSIKIDELDQYQHLLESFIDENVDI